MHQILLLGSGGREHAIAWKISQSPLCKKLFIGPGNAGTAACGINADVDPMDFEAVSGFALDHDISLIVVGPEAPLVGGIRDHFSANPALKHIGIIGPGQAGARLEGSKDFAKQFMQRYHIPTAAYQTFTAAQLDEGLAYIHQHPLPVVLKADGLAAGKGVLICQSTDEAGAAFRDMLDGKFGSASEKVVVEEFLAGMEFSVFILTDGRDYHLLPTAKDYKRIGEGDTGLNTGGMGAVSPVPFANRALMNQVSDTIIQPTLDGLRQENIAYTGLIYFGLINVNGRPYVIEYNIRMGDPETQVVMPRIKSDLVALFDSVVQNRIPETSLELDDRAATTIVMASGGYPGAYQKGHVISGWDQVDQSMVFHAGTQRKEDGRLVTSGGRVLAVTSLGPDITTALDLSLENAGKIRFEGQYYRKDIGFDLIGDKHKVVSGH